VYAAQVAKSAKRLATFRSQSISIEESSGQRFREEHPHLSWLLGLRWVPLFFGVSAVAYWTTIISEREPGF